MWEPRRLTNLWGSTACYRDLALPFYSLQFGRLSGLRFPEQYFLHNCNVCIAQEYSGCLPHSSVDSHLFSGKTCIMSHLFGAAKWMFLELKCMYFFSSSVL
jgi:hypothetical protein